MYSLEGKVYILTGGGGAVAGAIAESFARAGARLAFADAYEQPSLERAQRYGGRAFVVNLTHYPDAEHLVRQVKAQMGRVDGLIHTVGGFAYAPVKDTDPGLYDRMFDLNVRTLFYATRAVLPELLEQKDGFIAGIAAAAAWSGVGPGVALYAAAKAAVATYLRSLDAELGGTAIRVAVVYPMGAVDTPANRKEMPEADPMAWVDPAEIGESLVYAASRSPRGRVLELQIFPPR
ncbi:putative oxidoreductase [Meiothermus luteus]|jgi:NADP-dependent 3-hydroxy acid dehydrogenase YdfG|uniref:Putative oxidoreductase n=1 Tax=Meiothermus luteus TaxID=2026184 RepID=A0A399EU53_9DEIN|nr:SDR family NAD(P)-dependent oxidoreductase [Meiothermus luteus]RIH86629.1 putative oxidoreductase [Meiothermus luteus]RMH58113.1 MAG: SDR family NAD(P)-dependent oxidoreductase [Deinococcota bacterium]